MIDRKMLVERVLQGAGEPAGQMVPQGLFGYNPGMKPVAYDPDWRGEEVARRGGLPQWFQCDPSQRQ